MLWRASLLLLAALPALAGTAGEPGAAGPAAVGPAFAPQQHTQVLAPLGHAATLDCTVLRLADKAVSWVRSRDLQILAHAGSVFTADARVSLAARAGRHALHIERLRAADSGRYECQVNTEPKMSLLFNLTVVDEPVPAMVVSAPHETVWGTPGGAATLECEARLTPAPRRLPAAPLDLRWSHGARPVDLQSSRGGVSLHTERWAARALSRLTLAELRAEDAGEYTCAVGPSAAVLRLRLHELSAEAMQRDEAAPGQATRVARVAPLLAALAGLAGLLRAAR